MVRRWPDVHPGQDDLVAEVGFESGPDEGAVYGFFALLFVEQQLQFLLDGVAGKARTERCTVLERAVSRVNDGLAAVRAHGGE